jgi:hypothetical protein
MDPLSFGEEPISVLIWKKLSFQKKRILNETNHRKLNFNNLHCPCLDQAGLCISDPHCHGVGVRRRIENDYIRNNQSTKTM